MQHFVEHRWEENEEDRCPPKTLHLTPTRFAITFPDNMRMNFVVTLQHVARSSTRLKSGDELISLKETCGRCEGEAEQHYHIYVKRMRRRNSYHVPIVFGLRIQQSSPVDDNEFFPCFQLSGC